MSICLAVKETTAFRLKKVHATEDQQRVLHWVITIWLDSSVLKSGKKSKNVSFSRLDFHVMKRS